MYIDFAKSLYMTKLKNPKKTILVCSYLFMFFGCSLAVKSIFAMYDYLIVWAGLTWLVLGERLTKKLWKKILIIDKREHIWWNCYDYKDNETWITILLYWRHVFHTKDKEVRDYLKQFTEFTNYSLILFLKIALDFRW